MDDAAEKIEAYLNGTLPPAEREAFERALAADPALAEAVHWQRRIAREFGDADKMRLRRQLEEIGAQYRGGDTPPEETPGGHTPWRPGPWLWGALGLLVVGGLVWWGLSTERAANLPATAEPAPPPATLPVDTMRVDTPVVETGSEPAPPAATPQPPAGRPRGFQPNAELDALTNEALDPAYEFADTYVEITRLSADSAFLLLNGRLLTAQRPPELVLELVTHRYPRGAPLFRLPVELRDISEEGGVYAFGAREYALVLGRNIGLPEGSYYGIIRHGEKMVWVGRLRRTGF